MKLILRKYIISFAFVSLIFNQCDDLILGDANNDTTLDVVDIVLIVNMIFDQYDSTDIYILDVNQDTILDVIDVVILINHILDIYSEESNIINVIYNFNNLEINWDSSLNYGFEKYNR